MSGSNPHGEGQGSPADLNQYEFSFTYSLPSGEIEPDPAVEDLVESSWSLSESVRNFPEEFGRTYHAYKAGSYAFPNDAMEQERLFLQFNALTRLFGGKLFFAPLSVDNPPRLVLDVATGTGDWAIQMGDMFPQTQIVATDLSPIQPSDVPPNVSFFVEDSSEPWEFSQKYDYIHTRVTSACWASFEEQIARQAFDNLQPGGWFESQEYDSVVSCDDGTLPADGALVRWFQDMAAAGDICNRPTVMAHALREVYERVGFVDVQEQLFKMPTNGWPRDERLKDIGRMWERNFVSGLAGFSFSMFNRAFNRSQEEVETWYIPVRLRSRRSTEIGQDGCPTYDYSRLASRPPTIRQSTLVNYPPLPSSRSSNSTRIDMFAASRATQASHHGMRRAASSVTQWTYPTTSSHRACRECARTSPITARRTISSTRTRQQDQQHRELRRGGRIYYQGRQPPGWHQGQSGSGGSGHGSAQPTFDNTTLAVGAIMMAAAGFYAWNMQKVPLTGRWRFNYLSDEVAAWWHPRAAEEILEELRRQGVHCLPESDWRTKIVREVMRRLIPVSGLSDLNWELFVIDDDGTANAFVLPGGKVFVHSGILRVCGNSSALATVLGHEIAHQAASHVPERQSLAWVANMTLGSLFFLAGWRQGLALFALSVGVGGYIVPEILYSLPMSRTHELEADHIGLMMMAEACYDPEAAIPFWQRMGALARQAGGGQEVPEMASTHPTSDHRVAALQRLMPDALARREQSDCQVTASFAKRFRHALKKKQPVMPEPSAV